MITTIKRSAHRNALPNSLSAVAVCKRVVRVLFDSS